MIEFLKSYVLMLCVVAAIAGLLTLISPGGAYEKPIKLIIAVFMLICMVSPFAKGDVFKDIDKFKFEPYRFDEEEARSDLWEQSAKALEIAVKDKISGIILDKTGEQAGVTVSVTSEKESFAVREVRITGTEAVTGKRYEILEEIQKELGIKKEVIIFQGGE